jgi:hypothetical protein
MKNIDTARRELLKLGSMGLAAAAVTAAPALAAPKGPGPSAAFPAGAIFDIRTALSVTARPSARPPSIRP